jgi:glutamine amidotransferase
MAKKVVILDYGFGNIRSAQKSIQKIGAEVEISNDYDRCLNSDALVVPGVGAFDACMDGILKVRGDEIIDKRLAGNRKVLGICVGMQVMFESGKEHEIESQGLGQWPGKVEKINNKILPHMGWNEVEISENSILFKGLANQKFYFVHSYAAKELALVDSGKISSPLKHFTNYGEKFLASVESESLSATQFHPEKSGEAGLLFLKNWVDTI